MKKNIHVFVVKDGVGEVSADFSVDDFVRFPIIGETICIESKEGKGWANGVIKNIHHEPMEGLIEIYASEDERY